MSCYWVHRWYTSGPVISNMLVGLVDIVAPVDLVGSDTAMGPAGLNASMDPMSICASGPRGLGHTGGPRRHCCVGGLVLGCASGPYGHW